MDPSFGQVPRASEGAGLEVLGSAANPKPFRGFRSFYHHDPVKPFLAEAQCRLRIGDRILKEKRKGCTVANRENRPSARPETARSAGLFS